MSKSDTHQNSLTSSLKKTIIRLKTENAQLKNIIDNLPGDIYWKNKAGTWLGVNKAGYSTLQKMGLISSNLDIVGKTDYQLFKKETADLFRKHDLEVMEREVELLKEEENCLPSGEIIEQLSAKRPLYNEKGDVIGIIGNTLNIGHLKQKELTLRTAKNKAEAANQAKTEFIVNMSHDLRNPLSGIIGMSKILEEDAEDLQGRKYAQLINESSEQLLALLNSTLEVASADVVQENDIQNELFDLPASINAIVTLQLPIAKLKNLDLKIDMDNNVPNGVITDQNKLYRILLNLLGNAIKFTDKGYVAIEIKLLEQEGDDIKLRFSVHDTGIGISKEVQKKIFERFYCVHSADKKLYDGYGIGLDIAQKYAAVLRSTIQLRSEIGKGSTFYFDLSLKKGNIKNLPNRPINYQSDKIKSLDTHPNISAKIPHFLLIEDNSIVLFFLEQIVKQSGYHVTSVSNAEDALTLIPEGHFDIIMTDIELPGLSGFELSKSVRKWEITHQKPPVFIVALTGHSEQEIGEYKSSGINKILTKPICLDTIKVIVNEMIDCRKNRRD